MKNLVLKKMIRESITRILKENEFSADFVTQMTGGSPDDKSAGIRRSDRVAPGISLATSGDAGAFRDTVVDRPVYSEPGVTRYNYGAYRAAREAAKAQGLSRSTVNIEDFVAPMKPAVVPEPELPDDYDDEEDSYVTPDEPDLANSYVNPPAETEGSVNELNPSTLHIAAHKRIAQGQPEKAKALRAHAYNPPVPRTTSPEQVQRALSMNSINRKKVADMETDPNWDLYGESYPPKLEAIVREGLNKVLDELKPAKPKIRPPEAPAVRRVVGPNEGKTFKIRVPKSKQKSGRLDTPAPKVEKPKKGAYTRKEKHKNSISWDD